MKSILKAKVSLLLVAAGLALASPGVNASILYQSATAGPADCSSGGSIVDNSQFLGTRFSLSSSTTLTGVGGQVCGASAADDFFAAIVSLSGPGALPSFDPLDVVDNALASATFTPGDSGADTTIPFSITLGPGDYALIFGSGLLSTTGFGWMPDTNTELPEASYFSSDQSVPTWYDDNFSGARFFVTGDVATSPVPEPGTVALAMLGLGCGAWARRRQRRG